MYFTSIDTNYQHRVKRTLCDGHYFVRVLKNYAHNAIIDVRFTGDRWQLELYGGWIHMYEIRGA